MDTYFSEVRDVFRIFDTHKNLPQNVGLGGLGSCGPYDVESAIKKLYAAELFIKFVRSYIISPKTTQISMAGVVLPQLAVFLIMNIHIQAGISSFHSVTTFVFLAFCFGLIL